MNPSIRQTALLVIDDQPDAIDLAREQLERAGHSVLGATSPEQALDALGSTFIDLVLTDERLGRRSGIQLLQDCRERVPGLGAIVITGYADLECAVRAMRAGAIDLLQKPVSEELLLETVDRALAESRLAREARYHRWASNLSPGSPDLIGGSPAFKTALELARVVGASDATVLLEGESGTGKELFARAIHAWSPRQQHPFVAVNVGAIPESLMEAELFGARRGAYTGAHADRHGHFASAEGGTIFLDEIGETSPDIQVRLLRAIQEREITPLGDSKPRKIDVRIVAATNRDLKEEVDGHRFRRDLYYRLAVVKITLPPLRERLADIEPIALHFLEKQRHSLGKPIRGFAPDAIEKLQHHLWPGNVRELSNVIERAAIYAAGEWITPELLLLEVPGKGVSDLETLLDRKFREAETDFERLYFRRLLETHDGNKSKAAIAAGLERSVLHAHLRKVGIDSGPT